MRWINRLPLLRMNPGLLALGGLLIIIQICLSYLFTNYATDEFYHHVSLSLDGIKSGKVWTLVTYALFHHPHYHSHLLINCLMLFYYGGRLCHIFSTKKMLQILTYGIIVGGIAHILIILITGNDIILIGISGGTFALLSAYCIFAGDSRFSGIKGYHLVPILVVFTSLMILIHPDSKFTVFSKIYNHINSELLKSLLIISHPCHLGGLIAGWIVAAKMIRIPRPSKKNTKE